MKRNLRVGPGEIDLLVEDPARGCLVVIEVRGRESAAFRPSRWVSAGKIARLRKLGEWVACTYRRPVRVVFLEILGRIPDPSAKVPPRGLKWEAFEIRG